MAGLRGPLKKLTILITDLIPTRIHQGYSWDFSKSALPY